ncbi:MAG: ferritin-like domain-containing protein [Thermoanaerobaculia bacterium]
MHAPVSKPQRKAYRPIHSIESLHQHLQWALSIELSTIPPYLCALYSIQDTTTEAYSVIRSVVVEEMLHMMLVSNLLNATGATPKLSGDAVPRYPGYMPHHAAGGPFIQLQPYSVQLMTSTFMPIEQPEASPRVPAEGDNYQTLGQFYKAIAEGFERLVHLHGEKGVFGHDTGFQRKDTDFGNTGGHLIIVRDLESALAAINEITEQGEGATTPHPPIPGDEPFGGHDHYGPRADGTYGPILGTPWEMSHYYKFQGLADGAIPSPAVFPMQANPDPDQLKGKVRELSDLFDSCYALVLRSLERALGSPEQERNFFGIAFPVMHFTLPPLARLLMQTTLLPEAQGNDASLGPTAGPAFLVRDERLKEMVRTAAKLEKEAPKSRGSAYEQLWQGYLHPVVKALKGAAERAGSHDI